MRVRLLSLAVVQYRHILTSGGQYICRVSSGAFSPFNKSSQVKIHFDVIGETEIRVSKWARGQVAEINVNPAHESETVVPE